MKFKFILSILLVFTSLSINAAETLKKPDGKSADMTKPVQVYILMGQSNMLTFGKQKMLEDACKEGKYSYLVDESGKWTTRKDVRNIQVMGSGDGSSKTLKNEWMTISGNIGVEMGIGHHLGQATDAPVMILKSAIGNRSLGWDLLPPGSPRYSFEGVEQAGYKETIKSKTDSTVVPFVKGGDCLQWYAGLQYDGDVRRAKEVLDNLAKHYPGASKFEVAGFFWWQGDKDFRSKAHAAKYEENLLNLIAALRKDFNAPKAKFVCATLGQTKKGEGGTLGQVLNAQLAMGDYSKYPAHKGYVSAVYTNPVIKGGSSSGHYDGNAETYMNVGELLGAAMVELLKK
jgi:hypothetical protein